MTDPRPVEELGYLEALDELEQILDRLDRSDPDVDRVADDVARAAALVAHCRTRIEGASLQVDEVVAGLAGGADGQSSPDEDAR